MEGIRAVGSAMGSTISAARQLADGTERLAEIFQRAGAQLQEVVPDVFFAAGEGHGLSEEIRSVAEVLLAWREVGEIGVIFAKHMLEVSTTMSALVDRMELEKNQRLSEAERLNEAWLGTERKPRQWFFQSSDKAEVAEKKKKDQEVIVGTCRAVMEQMESVRLDGRRILADAVSRTRSDARPVGEKLMTLKTRWRGGLAAENGTLLRLLQQCSSAEAKWVTKDGGDEVMQSIAALTAKETPLEDSSGSPNKLAEAESSEGAEEAHADEEKYLWTEEAATTESITERFGEIKAGDVVSPAHLLDLKEANQFQSAVDLGLIIEEDSKDGSLKKSEQLSDLANELNHLVMKAQLIRQVYQNGDIEAAAAMSRLAHVESEAKTTEDAVDRIRSCELDDGLRAKKRDLVDRFAVFFQEVEEFFQKVKQPKKDEEAIVMAGSGEDEVSEASMRNVVDAADVPVLVNDESAPAGTVALGTQVEVAETAAEPTPSAMQTDFWRMPMCELKDDDEENCDEPQPSDVDQPNDSSAAVQSPRQEESCNEPQLSDVDQPNDSSAAVQSPRQEESCNEPQLSDGDQPNDSSAAVQSPRQEENRNEPQLSDVDQPDDSSAAVQSPRQEAAADHQGQLEANTREHVEEHASVIAVGDARHEDQSETSPIEGLKNQVHEQSEAVTCDDGGEERSLQLCGQSQPDTNVEPAHTDEPQSDTIVGPAQVDELRPNTNEDRCNEPLLSDDDQPDHNSASAQSLPIEATADHHGHSEENSREDVEEHASVIEVGDARLEEQSETSPREGLENQVHEQSEPAPCSDEGAEDYMKAGEENEVIHASPKENDEGPCIISVL